MGDVWLPGDPSLTPSSLSLSVDAFLDDQLSYKRQLFKANNDSFICKFFAKGQCMRGQECPYRHSRGDKPFVCKHWLRSLCKKGADACESLHVYDLSKMPFCQFVIDYGACHNPDCLFNHAKPETEEKECVWYSRGFCKRGPNCKNKHIRKEMCADYMTGFCELGPKCPKGHPKWLLPQDEEQQPQYDAQGQIIPGSELPRARTLRSLIGMDLTKPRSKGPVSMDSIVCNLCKQTGHLAGACPNAKNIENETGARQVRNLATVQCFRCGEIGHYATFCKNERREPPPGGWQLPPGARPRKRQRETNFM